MCRAAPASNFSSSDMDSMEELEEYTSLEMAGFESEGR